MPNLLLLLVVVVGMLAYAVIALGLSLSFLRVCIFLISLMFALILNFFMFYCVALLSFWLTDVNLIFGTVSVVLVVVSGGVFPLDIFGEKITMLVKFLPFGYTTQFPVNIINGKLPWIDVAVGIFCQVFWIVCFVILGWRLWKNGLKRFVAVGG